TLSFIPQLKDVAEIILYHHEDYSGTGFPYKLKGEDIPFGARILRIADSFDNLTNPCSQSLSKLRMDEAYRKLEEDTVKIYDQNIVRKFRDVLDSLKMSIKEKKRVVQLLPEDLKAGMVIAEDIKTSSGILIFKKDEAVNSNMLSRMHEYIKIDPIRGKISVYVK
ncbi:hypothetical protein DRH29_05605, partial [candidate division Kazan bacterium]